jgi:hypothetical protein
MCHILSNSRLTVNIQSLFHRSFSLCHAGVTTAVSSDNIQIYLSTFCIQNSDFTTVKAGGLYSSHYALQGPSTVSCL